MKSKLLTLALVLGGLTFASAADKHDHDHDHEHIKAGPTGGRVLTAVEPHAEFFVTKDNKVEIRFLDDKNKVVESDAYTVTVITGTRKSPAKLAFTKDGNKLVSDGVVPAGNNHPTVVQFRPKAGGKVLTDKFNLNLTQCPTCKNKEYACECEHGHDHDHDHKDEKKKK